MPTVYFIKYGNSRFFWGDHLEVSDWAETLQKWSLRANWSFQKILTQTQISNPLIRHLENLGSKFQILKNVCGLEGSFGDFLR